MMTRTLPRYPGLSPRRGLPFGDLAAAVRERKRAQGVMVMGSVSVVRPLMAHDLVDEYRLVVFPLVLGEGTRLFPDGTAPVNLALVSAGAVGGAAVRLSYARAR